MKHIKIKGIHDVESDVWDFYTLKEVFEHKNNCPNWKHCVADAKRYFGQLWHSDEIRYLVNNVPVYKMYRIVGFEDNNAWSDYYWILRPIDAKDDKRDRFELWNNKSFYDNIILVGKKNGKHKRNNKKNNRKNSDMVNKRRPIKKVSDK